jgi:membrane protein YqaA with SNARE-associated domain
MTISTLAVLFLTAFAAATILPLQSEALLAALIVQGQHNVVTLVIIAGVGNTLGAAVNWWLGRRIETFRGRSWFPASARQLYRAQGWYQRWGKYSLLLAWLPIGGDALTVIAGILREPLPVFLLLVGIGKFARYIVLALAVTGFL